MVAMDNKTFGAFIRDLREKRGLGVNQLAQYVGISGAEISRIERGERKKISPTLLRELAPRLGVTYEFLMRKIGYLSEANAETSANHEIVEKMSRLDAQKQAAIEKMIDDYLAEKDV